MAVSDAIVVGEDWISEHYFTTDAQASRSRPRCSSAARSGTPKPPKAATTRRRRFTARPRRAARPTLADLLDRRDADGADGDALTDALRRLCRDARLLHRRVRAWTAGRRAGHVRRAPPD